MGRRDQQRQEPTPPADPLADLRTDPVPGNATVTVDSTPEEAEAITVRPMVDEQTQDDMVSEVVAAWHRDPTCQGFLHGGAACGCRYIARLALQVAVPVMTEEDAEEQELEPSHG